MLSKPQEARFFVKLQVFLSLKTTLIYFSYLQIWNMVAFFNGILLDCCLSFSRIKKGNIYVMVRSMSVREREKQRRQHAGATFPLSDTSNAKLWCNTTNSEIANPHHPQTTTGRHNALSPPPSRSCCNHAADCPGSEAR